MDNEAKNTLLNQPRVQDKNFLQSSDWAKFQESVGRKTYYIGNNHSASLAGRFSASIIEHELPIVGKYFYVPRGPLVMEQKSGMQELIDLAKKENAGWIRIDPATEEALQKIKESISEKIQKAPHDMQPKEIFVLDISKTEEQLLSEMKSKTRYNIGVAKKKGVKIFCHPEFIFKRSERNETSFNFRASDENIIDISGSRGDVGMLKQVQHDSSYYVEEFLKLTKEMAQRQGIVVHLESYYQKMIESLPAEMLKIYVAEYEGKIIAANLVLFFGEAATYLHGASSNDHRNVMAPFLLQWQAILDAKEKGCTRYDFGGVKIQNTRYKIQDTKSWEGITKFKTGFSPATLPIVFPGSYDIIVNPRKYAVYRGLQRAKVLLQKIRR